MNNKNLEDSNFIKTKILHDLHNGKLLDNKVVLRFPPEPNGYLHLGHAKSIILNSYLAESFNGVLNLRFDDTNPEKENMEYVNAIKHDALWLSNKFTNIYWASDYFETIYNCAILLIKKGLAYIDFSSPEEIKNLRGDFNNTGRASEYRNSTVEENLIYFENMKKGLYAENACVLRAKIDLESSNINMRDPIIYRLKYAEHHNTGNKWCIYPMYDFAHPISDGIEGITHSICTLEFESHRPLYNWVIENSRELLKSAPVQIEFARLEMEGILLSKRKLNSFVEDKLVSGWDDSAMPTISGMRNRGYTREIITEFILKSGFSKANSTIEKIVLEDCVRNFLNPVVERRMCVIDPVEMEIVNYDVLTDIICSCPNHPKDETLGKRNITLTSTVYVEREDIRASAEKDFWRIYPGNWVRLKHAYNVFIKDVLTDAHGNIIKVIAEIDKDSKNMKMAKHKAKVALHWLNNTCHESTAYFYNDLIDSEGNYNTSSKVMKTIKVEPNMIDNCHYEFERNGYYYFKDNVFHCLAGLKK